MRIAIVEDEAVVARRLLRMVREILPAATLEVATTLSAARALLATRRPDVLLLDLNLCGRDGFALLTDEEPPIPTVIVSAHADQALRAFDHGVVDFVAKPWTADRLRKALARATAGLAAEPVQSLAVRRGRQVRPVPVARLAFVRAAGDYAELHLADGTVHLHGASLSALEQTLPARFLRIHRSHLVDVERVRALRGQGGGGLALEMEGGQRLPVGRRYRNAVRARLGLGPGGDGGPRGGVPPG
jgi:DNA-binding LytR/AlgR family response regulator